MNYSLLLVVAPGTLSPPTATPRATVRCGDPASVQELLSRDGVVRDGHFALLGGLHSDRFLAFSALARDEGELATIGDWLSPAVAAWSPTVIVAPTTAGVSLASELARRTGTRLELAVVDDEGRPAQLIGERVDGERIVVVNDVVTTGVGLTCLANLAAESGATVVGAAWFASRTPLDVATLLGVAQVHVADVDLAAWHEHECPLCAQDARLELALDLN